MALYSPEGVHVGDDADPHGNGFTLLAYNTMPGDIGDAGMQGAVCLVPKSHRLPYNGHKNEGERTSQVGGDHARFGGNYATYLWDGQNFLAVEYHWNIVEAVNRYVEELGGEI